MNPERAMKIWTIPRAPTLLTGVVARSFPYSPSIKFLPNCIFFGAARGKVPLILPYTNMEPSEVKEGRCGLAADGH